MTTWKVKISDAGYRSLTVHYIGHPKAITTRMMQDTGRSCLVRSRHWRPTISNIRKLLPYLRLFLRLAIFSRLYIVSIGWPFLLLDTISVGYFVSNIFSLVIYSLAIFSGHRKFPSRRPPLDEIHMWDQIPRGSDHSPSLESRFPRGLKGGHNSDHGRNFGMNLGRGFIVSETGRVCRIWGNFMEPLSR